MARWFNVAGPCRPDDNYMLSATARLPEVMRLISQKLYFVIHAPRQTGKTTAMLTLAQELTRSGKYVAVMLSVEVGAPFPDDPDTAELAILDAWRSAAAIWLPPALQPPPWPESSSGRRIGAALNAWAQVAPRPLVVFLDEIDALQNETLLSVLRQLRDGYPSRPQGFPWSLGLVGLRDVRDYKMASGGSDRLRSSSPFNIKTRSLTMRNFHAEEVASLYGQHTADTGQVFASEAAQHAFDLTQGQPWLVNALAKVAVEELTDDPTIPITVELIDQAKEVLIQRQDTHLDSLAERLREPRVRAIIEPILAGSLPASLPPDDLLFVQDLGLVRAGRSGQLQIANPIYEEIIPLNLTMTTRAFLPTVAPIWLQPDGRLNPARLLDAFLSFWRQHGEPLFRSAPYHEIAPHLVLMAFLHRVVNGGGTIEREYAIGTERMDLCLRYGDVTIGMELKVWRAGRPDPLPDGLAQLDTYLNGLGLDTGWLIIFDRRPDLPPVAERTSSETARSPAGRHITVVRG
ncbi:MAG: ATP-binding protein [Chloroflexaceae bacterium]|nr:ATP-binding protein [Chloroflexaceae bacterium]